MGWSARSRCRASRSCALRRSTHFSKGTRASEDSVVAVRTGVFYLAAAAFLPLALMSGVGLLELVHQQRQQAERTGIEITRALSTAVDAELQRSISALQVIASSPALERREMSRFYQVIMRAVEYSPTWLTVILAEPSGKQV